MGMRHGRGVELAALTLNHLNVPARGPDGLRRWYVEKLGLSARGPFLWSGGSLLVFVPGAPLPADSFHFGFRVESLEQLDAWATSLRARDVDVGAIERDAQPHARLPSPQ